MKRFLSIIALLTGIGIVAYSVYLAAIGMFTGDFMTRNMIFAAVGVLFAVLGIWGNVRLNKRLKAMPEEQRAAKRKKYGLIAIICAVVIAGPAITVVSNSLTKTRMHDAVFENCRDEYSATYVEAPENVKFVFVDAVLANGRFSEKSEVDTSNNAPYGKYYTSNPNKVNVAVFYRVTTEKIGTWVTQSGSTISGAYAQKLELSVVRLSDWALISENSIPASHKSENLSKDKKTYTIDTNDEKVVSYLTELFE